MKNNNRYIATLILIIVTIGFFVSYPFSDSFVGGLLKALFGASMIGGFADWFGITALFRKPLGIPFRTEIIPKNRDRIFTALTDMVENELLSKEALINKLEKINISERLVFYLDSQDGKKELFLLVNKIAEDLLGRLDPAKAADYLEKIIMENSDNIRLSSIFNDALDWIAKNKPDERVLLELIETAEDVILSHPVKSLVEEAVENLFAGVGQNVEKESAGKRLFLKLALSIAGAFEYSPSKISNRLISNAVTYLRSLKDPDSWQRKNFESWVESTINSFKENREVQDKMEAIKNDLFARALHSPYFAKHLAEFINAGGTRKISGFIEKLIEKTIDDFIADSEKQERFNRYIKGLLARLIEQNHGAVGKLVRQKLEQYSNEMLVELIEEKAGNDLQIIRINGSLVGGLTGVVIFLLTFLL